MNKFDFLTKSKEDSLQGLSIAILNIILRKINKIC